ncbi:MAG: CxxxxCH/CxxCH domain-containing protein [Candidatus Zixiibacteriota bacterium]
MILFREKIRSIDICAALILTVFFSLIIGCSSDHDNPTLPDAHPDAWLERTSSDFHANVVLSTGVEGCRKCHGSDLDGGKAGVSCIDCHASLTGFCTACHGGYSNQTGAPPYGLRGETDDTTIAVGAHTVHMEGSELASALDCSFCHNVPAFVFDSAHYDNSNLLGGFSTDSVAEIVWHGDASWNRDTRTCSGTYCHGAFDGGYNDNAPIWTADNQAECGSCHDTGNSPVNLKWKHEFHVGTAGLKCGECHANVVDTTLAIIQPGLHVNGIVDTLTRDPAVCETCHKNGGISCISCHGGIDNETGAPPKGLRGELATGDRAVGGHTAHLEDGSLADAFNCSECHIVPESFASDGHIDPDSVAEITWGTLAGDQSSWNRNTEVCSNTYCHGNFDGGNNLNIPVWTAPDQAVCGSCHDIGDNPATLHWKHAFHINTAGLYCADCHADVVDTLLAITDISLHVNGETDIKVRDTAVCASCHGSGPAACTSCHGGIDNQTGAPPAGLEGEALTSELAVGAHTSHMASGELADAFECGECHKVPATLIDPGHLDADSIAEITWGPLAGDQSSWDRISASCSGTYCHGNFEGGYSDNAPVWTANSQSHCGSCHDIGYSPEDLLWKHEYHVQTGGLACADCHSNVVDASLTIVGPELHVNGVVDTLTSDTTLCVACHGFSPEACTRCHGGTDNMTGAPPVGLRGETLTTQLAVGAHTGHMEGGTYADAFNCSDCHQVPNSLTAPGHLGVDSVAELSWSVLAGSQSTWNRSTARCSLTYCHGNFSGGYSANAPIWTAAGQAGCRSCHDDGTNPANLSGRHYKHIVEENVSCMSCHFNTVNIQKDIIGRGVHVDGIKTVTFAFQGSYSNGTCSGLPGQCHGSENWFSD